MAKPDAASTDSSLPAISLAGALTAEAETLDRELTEIEMLIAQAKQESGRHEQKRATSAEKLALLGDSVPKDAADLQTQVATLTRRATLMEAQVDVLEGKRKALERYRDSLRRHAELASSGLAFADPADAAAEGREDGPKAISASGLTREVLVAQEDLRREIARAMHDGPAQSLTNIVLQAQIVERLVGKDPEQARGEVRLLVSMVQQTLDATKSFIFDVRPMVLDDLGLVPTLRRAARDRGRRAGVAIDFESVGADRRLPVEIESGLFRILDEALAAYLSTAPDTIALRLDWSDRVEATVIARRAGADLAGVSPEPDVPEGKDLPPALAAMLEDRRADRQARVDAAVAATIAALPEATWREIEARAATIGVVAGLHDGGGTLRITHVPEAEPAEPGAAGAAGAAERAAE